MVNKHYLAALLIFTCFLSVAQNNYAPDRLICKFKDSYLKQSFLRQNLVSVFAQITAEDLDQTYPLIGREEGPWMVSFQSSSDILSIIKDFQDFGIFEYVEPDFIGYGGGKMFTKEIRPDDNFFFRQWGLVNDGSFNLSTSTVDADIDMDEAWELQTGSENLIVAILDSGLKLDHPEFQNRIWKNIGEKLDTTDTDSNGYVDDFEGGWDFVNNDNQPLDDHGHGTNVAGIALATGNNGLGYAGIDWNSKIMVCKILNNNNSGFYSDWTAAIYYAVDNGAKVINMSVGGSSYSSSMQAAVTYAHEKGVVIVVSMMNVNSQSPYYPAAYNETIAVGSTDSDDRRTQPFFWDAESGSNYGDHIDVVAPGNYIFGLNYQSNTNFGSYWGGTSQAAPHVAGLCALLFAQDPTRTPDEIREIIQLSAEDQVSTDTMDIPGFDIYYGHGRINAFEALAFGMTTASKKLFSENGITIYPNPGSNQEQLVISFDQATVDQIYAYVSDIQGKMFSKFMIPPGHSYFNVDTRKHWPTGLLILTLKSKYNVKTFKILNR